MVGKIGSHARLWVQRHEVLAYLVLAFALSWSIWPLVLVNPDSSPLVPFGPALAAVAVCLVTGGRRRVRELLAGLVRFRAHPLWYAVALVLPLALTGLPFVIIRAAGAARPAWEVSDALQVLASIAVLFVIVGLFEELGWRGFMLPALQKSRSAVHAALLVGVAWLPWHLPELVSDSSQRPVLQFALIILGHSVLLAWLYNSSRAALPVAMLFHASFNSFAKMFFADLDRAHYAEAWWLLAAFTVASAVAVVWAADGDTLTRSRAPVPTQA